MAIQSVYDNPRIEPLFDAASKPLPNDQAEPIELAGKRVVIVEDEGITQMQLRRMLDRAGMTVVGTANNGQVGVDTVLREHPDIVLMDIRMPVMDGIEATRRILAQYPVCIVMLTAFANEEYQQEAGRLGVSGYILKPITGAALLPQIEAAYQTFHPENAL